jgi:hypothetical protein
MLPRPVALALLALLFVNASAAESRDRVEAFAGDLPEVSAGSPRINCAIDLRRELFAIHVPANYDGSQPFGLIVFIPAAGLIAGAPNDWDKVLEQRRLLWVAPQRAVNSLDGATRLGLGVIAARKMQERYKIDPRRIYAAGISGGARTAGRLGFFQPDLFRGTIQSCGADFPRAVPRVKAVASDREPGPRYGVMEATAAEVQRARKNVRFVIVTGPGDFRYGNLLDIYFGGFNRDGFKAALIDVPEMKHEVCSGESLRRALDFLEQAP